MATSTKEEAVVTTTADCGDPTSTVTETAKPDPIRLAAFALPMSASDSFSRTARYAADPKAYLIDTVGQSSFDERKHLLSLSETVDKDVYGTGKHKTAFEQHIANTILGKQHGLFFITGVQAQLCALKIHSERRGGNPRVAWHSTCHLEAAEEKSYETLYGLQRILLGSDPDALPTVDDIKALVSLPEAQRPATILLELGSRMLGSQTHSFADLEAISSICHEHNIALHCDGARLWEIEPFYQASADANLAKVCSLFDTVYVSFYKALGGASGAILATDDQTVAADARMWQRRAGGNAFTLAYNVIDCERGFNENIGTFAAKWAKLKVVTAAITEATKPFTVAAAAGDKGHDYLVKFRPETPTCSQVRTQLNPAYSSEQIFAARDKAELETNTRVLEQLWPPWSLDEKMAATRAGKAQEDFAQEWKEMHPGWDQRWHEFEWSMRGDVLEVETGVIVDAWVAFCKALVGEGEK